MSRPGKPWTKAQVRRVIASTFVGGYTANRSRNGWSIWLTGDGAGPSRRRVFVPAGSLEGRSPAWLKNLILGGMRRAVERWEGVTSISGREAQVLTQWCVRRSRSTRIKLNARQRARASAYRRWYHKAYKVPLTTHGGGYEALRSRRGWVVRLSTNSGTLRECYLIPFRAFGQNGRRWEGRAIFDEILRRVRRLPGARRTNDNRIPGPTIWKGMP